MVGDNLCKMHILCNINSWGISICLFLVYLMGMEVSIDFIVGPEVAHFASHHLPNCLQDNGYFITKNY